jgi:tRNA nucleotidyltransferase/poly(A) polymerase
MKPFRISKNIAKLNAVFRQNGHSLYLVGGAVRDHILGIDNSDYDFTTDATPEEMIAMFPHRTIPTGIKHGTITVRMGGEGFEITTFRSEGDYQDGRHPSSVTFVRDLSTDLERRDFTINALALDLESGKIIDEHGGLEDLKNGLIRAIGVPEERFDEDGLRLLRACRFSAKLGFPVEEQTFLAMKAKKDNIRNVSAERIREELFKLLVAAHPAMGLETFEKSGLLFLVLPEFKNTVGMEQKGMHRYDVWMHSVIATEAAAKLGYDKNVRIAAFFHDVGKAVTRKIGADGCPTFYSHDAEGERITKCIMKRLKCSNAETEEVTLLVREHMFHYTPDWTDAAVRRFIKRVGLEEIPRLFDLRICDQIAIAGEADERAIGELEERIRRITEKDCALSIKDLAVNGNSLFEAGIPKGKHMGQVLNYLLDQVIEDPSLNEKDKLTKLALSYFESLLLQA